MAGKVLCERRGAIGVVTFDNVAKRNAMSLDMWQATEEIVDALERDPAIRVVVLAGAGDKAFVSGADISRFEGERASDEAVRRYGDAVERVYRRIHRFAKPTIAMIRGYCIGGGLKLAVCCDMRYSNEAARFALPAARLGLGYGYDGIRRFIETIGVVATKEIFLTARQATAAEALRWNLVNAVFPDELLEQEVMGIAEAISGHAPLTIAAIKRATTEVLKDEADRDVAACDAMVAACFASADYREGRRAFLEKRKPRFTGG
ncbi:MAG: enoyl-CoA hydratase [Alphaproteobacteria bacterium]|nr:enoyl-CoA hydratase [Alphaproteobacteria bacterium]